MIDPTHRPPASVDPGPDWLVVWVDLPPRGQEHLAVEALRRAGARSVSREGERAVAHFPGAPDPTPRLRRVEAALRLALPGIPPVLSWRWESWEAWAHRWRAAHPPREVGRRFRILTAASADEPHPAPVPTPAPPRSLPPFPGSRPPDPLPRLPIVLEPGVGFGTGEHPTTRSCLQLLEDRIRPGDAVADVGSGSGVLALAAALLGAARVEAFEMDPDAARGARASARATGVEDRVRVRTHAVRGEGTLPGAPFTGVMANLEGPLLFPLLSVLRGALSPGGWLLVSGLLPPERDRLLQAPACRGLTLGAEQEEEGWWTGVLASPDPAGHPLPNRVPARLEPERDAKGRG
jgi:ribosomal protein L11 methyltransferase